MIDRSEQLRGRHGDHRLVGELPDDLDLVVGEGVRLIAPHRHDADDVVLPQHRHTKHRPEAAQTLGRGVGVLGILLDVRHVHHLPRQRRPPH